jgi:hypothetical protein
MSGKEFQRGLQSAHAECDRLREENKRLRELLAANGISIPAFQTQGPTLVQSVGSAIDVVSQVSDTKAKLPSSEGFSLVAKMSMRCDGKILMAGPCRFRKF